VIADQDYQVAAYAGLSMTAVDHSAAPTRLRKSAPDPVPALLIGRLAVDSNFTGLGVGTTLVRHPARHRRRVEPASGLQRVVVTALHEPARS